MVCRRRAHSSAGRSMHTVRCSVSSAPWSPASAEASSTASYIERRTTRSPALMRLSSRPSRSGSTISSMESCIGRLMRGLRRDRSSRFRFHSATAGGAGRASAAAEAGSAPESEPASEPESGPGSESGSSSADDRSASGASGASGARTDASSGEPGRVDAASSMTTSCSSRSSMGCGSAPSARATSNGTARVRSGRVSSATLRTVSGSS